MLSIIIFTILSLSNTFEKMLSVIGALFEVTLVG